MPQRRPRIPTGLSVEQKFLHWVTYEPNSGCWLWTGRANSSGYGVIPAGNQRLLAHRQAYLLYRGTIPDGLLVLHSCDQPACCCPDHLRVGTNLDNMRDKVERHRCQASVPKSQGENHYASRLTNKAVADIRTRRMTQMNFAALYGVSISTINRAMHGHTKFDPAKG